MFAGLIEDMRSHFTLTQFQDCAEVTHPSEKMTLYILMCGSVNIISDERVFNKAGFEVKKKRRKVAKQKAKDLAEGKEKNENEGPEEIVLTDFPFAEINKTDFKVFDVEGMTFGNDKIVTTKGFRPSFGMTAALDTRILSVNTRIIEEAIKKLANSGENKEKTDFMKRFDWFESFTQSLKTKFNNVITKQTFYPGTKIITEGGNNLIAYVIVEGTCNLVSHKTGQKLTVLEYRGDPTKAKRDREHLAKLNENQKNNRDRTVTLQPLIQNGYVSDTLRTIQIGMKSTGEWIGEDLLIMDEPHLNSFDYSAIAVTKCVTYMIQYADMFKIT